MSFNVCNLDLELWKYHGSVDECQYDTYNESVMANLMFYLAWDTVCPDIWLNIISRYVYKGVWMRLTF